VSTLSELSKLLVCISNASAPRMPKRVELSYARGATKDLASFAEAAATEAAATIDDATAIVEAPSVTLPITGGSKDPDNIGTCGLDTLLACEAPPDLVGNGHTAPLEG